MYSSKSFSNIGQWMSNVPGQNAPIGEVSAYGMTFSKEVGVYTDPNTPGYALYNFKSATDGQGGGLVTMDGVVVNASIALIKFLVTTVTSQSGQIYADQLLETLATWGAQHGVSNISIGAVNPYDNVGGQTQVWCPDWIKFKCDALVDPSNQPLDNENTIWLSVTAFESQYDEYQIVVVPPIDNLDLFFGTGASVIAMVQAITTTEIIDRMAAARGGFPETIPRSDPYTYYDPLNSNNHIDVQWPVLIYGPGGNNVDAIKQVLQDYILAHSTHPRADWIKIFPDIFKRTEFMMIPAWQNYAIPNRTQAAGIYSPVGKLTAMNLYIKQVVSGYPTNHVDAHAEMMGHPYRSLAMMTVGGPENRNALYEILQVFPDYIDVSSTSIEFNRMSPETQGWCLMIAQMIIIAETMGQYTTLPQGMTKLMRDNVLYLVKTYQNIQYLVATKASVYTLLGLPMN